MAPRKPAGTQIEGVALLAFGGALLVALGLTTSEILPWASVLDWLGKHGPETALVLLAVLCMAVGLEGMRRPAMRSEQHRPLQPIRWWVIAAAIVIVVAATWAGLKLLLELAPPSDPVTRLDAVKTALAIGAASGATVALLFTARRQWLGERAQAHTELDAAERRVGELYHKAAEQFGTDKDPLVRLAGLYALADLAQQHPEKRRTIVNIICDYLRTPFPAGGMRNSAAPPVPRRDLPVRQAAQTIIAEHLRPNLDHRERPTNPKFWPGIDLDLAGATLTDLDLSDCHLGVARFTGTRFTGTTTFRGTHFTKQASFRDGHFAGPVEFRNAAFADNADFTDTRFGGDSVFRTASFAAAAWFTRSRFAGEARFLGAEFSGDTEFAEARFTGIAEFVRTKFTEKRAIHRAHFTAGVDVLGAEFGDTVVSD